MQLFQKSFTISTFQKESLIDITGDLLSISSSLPIQNGILTVFVQHATASIAINENADPNIRKDFVRAMKTLLPKTNAWLHDQIDGNAAAHLKAALIGPSETIPFQNKKLLLGRWQNVFLCEWDGPRSKRTIYTSWIGT